MAQIINTPEVPHISTINNGLSPGTLIRIQGTATPAAQRFNINLQCGPNVAPRDDIALHLSVRVAENCVGRNILDKQMWGEEQNQGGNPIEAGQQFEILVLCDQMDYKIAINGRHFCEFPHKIPVNRVSHLTIDGDVTMKLISYEMSAAPSAPAAPPPTGPMPGYGGPQMYGPPGGPQGGYGQPPPQGGYGQPAYGGYGPPPPPGHAEGDKSGSGLEGFLGQAGTAIAGAFGQAVLQGALSGKQNNNQPQATQQGGQSAGGLGSIGSFLASTLSNQQAPNQPHPPQQQQQQPLAGGYGGQSVGGLGSIGSFLSSTLTNTILKPQQQQPNRKLTKREAREQRKAAKHLAKQERRATKHEAKQERRAAKKAHKSGAVGLTPEIGFKPFILGSKHKKKHHKEQEHSSSSSSRSDSD